jgi:cyclase
VSTTSAEAGGPATTTQVADGVFAYVQPDGGWWINNAGFLVGKTGILSIDTVATARRAEAYRAAIEYVSPLPVRTIVNTHHHGDHTNGNFIFANATIAAHRLCRVEIQAVGLPGPRQAITWDGPADWGDLKSAPPFLTYEGGIDLWVDDLRVEVRHLGGPAHTTNDSIVWVPDRSVLFTGDLVMNGCTPFFMNGSLAGSLRALEHLRALQPATIVPGHGPVGGPELLDAVTDYLLFVDDTARRAHAAGLTPLEAARACDLGEYADLLDRERIAGNLHRAIAELDGDEGIARFDRARALADMVTYNGGRLVSHA